MNIEEEIRFFDHFEGEHGEYDVLAEKSYQRILGVLAERRSPTFFVLNKADHLTSDELADVRRFVEEIIKGLLGHEVSIFALDARAALACRRWGSRQRGWSC